MGRASRQNGRRCFQNFNRHQGKPRGRWEKNIRIYLKEIGIKTRNWIDSTQDGIIEEPL